MSDYQLSQIAIMHYENGLSQQEIANLLGNSKMTVSRMLQKAKDKDIIQINVKLPFELDRSVGEKVRKKFGLNKVWALDTGSGKEDPDEMRGMIAKAAAFILNTDPPSNLIVGIGIGRTIGQVVKHLSAMKTEEIHVVQLMGGLPDVTKENPFSIIQETCRKWNAAGTFLTSFATAENREARDSFFQNSDTGKMVFDLWKKCDKALFGIGTIEKGTLLSPKLVGPEDLKELKSLDAVGDILGHCFTKQGEFVQSSLEERLVSIPVDLLRNIPSRRAVVVGGYKVPSILGAIRTGIINELFTDRHTAEELLAEE